MDDREAIHRMKNGEISGLEKLVTKYQVRAVRTAFLITHDEALAQDVAQDTFIRFYQRIKYFDETRAVEPYLMRSVVNAALNAVRRERKVTSLDADLAFLVLGHEDVEGGIWASFFCHWPSFGLFGLIILGGCSSPTMTSLPLVDLA